MGIHFCLFPNFHLIKLTVFETFEMKLEWLTKFESFLLWNGTTLCSLHFVLKGWVINPCWLSCMFRSNSNSSALLKDFKRCFTTSQTPLVRTSDVDIFCLSGSSSWKRDPVQHGISYGFVVTSPVHVSSGLSKICYLLHIIFQFPSTKGLGSWHKFHHHGLCCLSEGPGRASWKRDHLQPCVSYGSAVTAPVHVSSGLSNTCDLLPWSLASDGWRAVWSQQPQ